MTENDDTESGEEAEPGPGSKQPIDAEGLKSVTDRMTPQAESAGSFVRRMRDEDRY
jgi:hypothetical protein